MGINICLLFIVVGFVHALKDETSIVDTLNGPIKGFKFKLPVIERDKTDIKTANIYLGIPYAQPPVKDLRFEVSY
jgi:hypothetical protein